jgi:hypothetical protein
MRITKVGKIVSSVLVGVMLSAFCVFPALAAGGTAPAAPVKGKLMTGTFSQKFQLTNDKAHNQVIFKNLDTGVSETFSLNNSQKTSNVTMQADGISPPVPSGWTELNVYPSYTNSTYVTFNGMVNMVEKSLDVGSNELDG